MKGIGKSFLKIIGCEVILMEPFFPPVRPWFKTTDRRVILRSQRPGQPPPQRPCYLTKKDPWHRISCVDLCGHKGMQYYHWRHRRQQSHHTQGPGWINHRALRPEAQHCVFPLHSTAGMQHKLICIMYRSHGPSTLLQLHLLKKTLLPCRSCD